MAVRFDAVSESYTRAITGLSAWTVVLWVYPTSDTDHGPFGYGQANAGGQAVFISRIGVNTLKVFDSGNYGSGFGSFVYSLNSWSAHAVAVSGADCTWYHGTNPSALTSDSVADLTSPTSGSQSWFLGIDSFDAQWWRGRIASVKIWNAQLTAAEVAIEAAQYVPRRIANLIQWHPFVRVETVDYSGIGNTLSGGSGASTEDGPPIPWQVKDVVVTLPAGSSSQTVVIQLITASSTLFDPTVVPGSVSVVTPLLTTTSNLFDPTIENIAQVPLLTNPSTVFEPTVVPGSVTLVLPLLTTSSTLFDPTVINDGFVEVPSIQSVTEVFDPTVVNLLQIISTQLIQTSSVILSPAVSGGSVGGSYMGSIMDRARVNMLLELSLSEPQLFTNTDLMRQVIIDPGQTTITVTDASAANQLWQYLKVVRDS